MRSSSRQSVGIDFPAGDSLPRPLQHAAALFESNGQLLAGCCKLEMVRSTDRLGGLLYAVTKSFLGYFGGPSATSIDIISLQATYCRSIEHKHDTNGFALKNENVHC